MFDARSLLEQIVNGSNRNPNAAGAPSGSLGDLLGGLLGGAGQSAPGAATGGGNALEDILRNLVPSQNRNVATGAGPAQAGAEGGGGLADILGKLQQSLGGQGGAGGGGLGDILGKLQHNLGGQGTAGGIGDILGQILSQATQGVQEGAGRVSDATGARKKFNEVTGKAPEDLVAQLKELIANHQLGAGAALGGLGGLVLGTQTGRGLAVSATKIGALALIGGLAYKAYQNYQSGKPLITGAHPAEVAPQGTGFEPQALTNQSATTYIRAMIAAADADGRIDDGEKQRIFGALKQGGLEAEAEAFLQRELAQPASIDDLAAAVTSPEEAAQVYTAARIAIEPDTSGENAFLATLADRLGIDRQLAALIDNEARTTSA